MRLTNPYEWHETDMLRGLRDFRRGRDTAHRDAFEVFMCRVGWGVLRLESMVDDWIEAHVEASKKRGR